jgi:hypothetical protein
MGFGVYRELSWQSINERKELGRKDITHIRVTTGRLCRRLFQGGFLALGTVALYSQRKFARVEVLE